jgi:hypothetical protein
VCARALAQTRWRAAAQVRNVQLPLERARLGGYVVNGLVGFVYAREFRYFPRAFGNSAVLFAIK